MTLKEECEILRGQPILLKTPADQVPCNETSDSECLCKNPVVSVHMLTYNHELYIREAIDGVVMQETDFEYELIIGEDASQDRTREICFEYQKKYPDKIRVLWSEENVTKPYGGNGARVTARCRGEFIAFCEGDDYWVDPKKLQKQVDAMRANPTVGFCFCGASILQNTTGKVWDWDERKEISSGVLPGKRFLCLNILGRTPFEKLGKESFLPTASVMVRKSVCNDIFEKQEFMSWRLRLGDVPLWLCLASCSDVYYLPDVVSVYRLTSTGACATMGADLWLDNLISRMYFFKYIYHLSFKFLTPQFKENLVRTLVEKYSKKTRQERKEFFTRLKDELDLWEIFRPFRFLFFRQFFSFCSSPLMQMINSMWMWLFIPKDTPTEINGIYMQALSKDVKKMAVRVRLSFLSMIRVELGTYRRKIGFLIKTNKEVEGK